LIDAALHQAFVELHVGDAVHEQAADAVGAFEDGDEMAGAVELGGGAEAGRAGADDGDLFAGAHLGASGLIQPSSQPRSAMAHSMFLMVTGGEMMPRTQEPSHGAGQTRPVKVGEVVGFVQAIQSLMPEAAIDEVVPFRDEVVNGAAGGHAAEENAGVAERHAAIHAAGALLAQLFSSRCR
jgi:hypothetical protein